MTSCWFTDVFSSNIFLYTECFLAASNTCFVCIRYMFSCLKFEAVHAKPLSVYLMIRVVCHFTVWFLHRASEQLQKCNTDVSVWYRPPSITPRPQQKFIHRRGISFIFQNKILQREGGGGGATVQAHKVGLPLWLHLHILQESSTTTEFISYFREPGRSTTASPPCQRASETDSERIRKRKPRFLTILRVNFSPGLTFTTPQTAAAAGRFACQHRGPLLPSFLHLLLFNARMEEEDCGND